MDNFKIEFTKIAEIKSKNLGVETYGKISLYFDNKLVNPLNYGDYTCEEYLWYFFYALLPEVKHYDEFSHKIDFFASPFRLYFKRTMDEIELQFGSYAGSLSDKVSPPSRIISKTRIPYKAFLEEVLWVSGEFLEQILRINPSLKSHAEVVKFVHESEGVKKLYEKLRDEG